MDVDVAGLGLQRRPRARAEASDGVKEKPGGCSGGDRGEKALAGSAQAL